jgi:6-pyruvoyl-tetrahydropterin synthase
MLWGQNLQVRFGATAPIDQESGIAINSKVLGKVASEILKDFDHQTWNYSCSAGLARHGINFGLASHLATLWDERIRVVAPHCTATNCGYSPSRSATVLVDGTGGKIEIVSQHKAAILGAAILRRDPLLSLNAPHLGGAPEEVLFAHLRHPADSWASSGAAITFHIVCLAQQRNSTDSAAPLNERICINLLDRLAHCFNKCESTNDLLDVLQSFHIDNDLELGSDFRIQAIEIRCAPGFSLHQEFRGNSYLEYRIGFNATHQLRLPKRSAQDNQLIFGPCTNFPYHGHRWGLRLKLRTHVGAQNGAVISQRISEVVKNLWQMLHGSHLNSLLISHTTVPATSEAILGFAKAKIACADFEPVALELMETPRNVFTWEQAFDT